MKNIVCNRCGKPLGSYVFHTYTKSFGFLCESCSEEVIS